MRPSIATVTLNPAVDQTVLLERLVPGAVHRAPAPRLAAGGKGVNVACVLAVLGVPVTAMGWLGADNAALFEAAFMRHGVHDGMVRVPGATRVNLKLTDRQEDMTTEVNFPGIDLEPDAAAQAEARLLQTLLAWLRPGDRVVLAGSLPPGRDASIGGCLLAAVDRRGAQSIVDVDPVAWARLLADPRTGAVQLAKPNREELQALAGRSLDHPAAVADAAQSLLGAHGVRRVLVSLGPGGVVLAGPEGRWHAPAPEVPDLVSTSGAGDALLAGTLAAWQADCPFPDAVRLGMACAAWRIGTAQLCPVPQDTLRHLARQIVLHPV